jgi:hypothetical protein
MIRTLLSFGLLFGGLLVVSKYLHETTQPRAQAVKPGDPAAQPEAAAAEPSAREPARLRSAEDDARPANLRLVAFEDDLLDALKDDQPAQRGETNTAEPAVGATAKRDAVEIEITPELEDLRGRIRECLAYYYFKLEKCPG